MRHAVGDDMKAVVEARDFNAHAVTVLNSVDPFQDEGLDRFRVVGQDGHPLLGHHEVVQGAAASPVLCREAFSTASGNLAGWAVARVTMGPA